MASRGVWVVDAEAGTDEFDRPNKYKVFMVADDVDPGFLTADTGPNVRDPTFEGEDDGKCSLPPGQQLGVASNHRRREIAFHPMQSQRVPVGTSQSHGIPSTTLSPSPYDAELRMMAGFSPNYQGNIFNRSNQSADIPPHLNCSVWITGLAPTVTVTSLLRGLRDIGRIYAVVINPPEPARQHWSCAAKIQFFDRASADRFMDRHGESGLQLLDHPGYRARVFWNRILAAAIDRPRHHTRVLLINGPEELVNPAFLHGLFRSLNLSYEVDDILELGMADGRRLIEFRFGSYRAQAEAAKLALERMYKNVVQVGFGRDPCDICLK